MEVHQYESDILVSSPTALLGDRGKRFTRRQGAFFSPNPVEVKELWKTVCWSFDLFDNSPNADFSVDLDGIIRCCNRRAAEILGYDRNILFGMSIHSLYADTPEGKVYSKRLFAECRRGTLIEGEELQMQKSDGTLIWVTLSARPVLDDGDRITEIRLAVLDISELKTAQAEKTAAHSMVAIGTLAGGIAHDFNNLLCIFQGNIDLAKTEVMPQSNIHGYLNAAGKACQQAAALAGRLLTFSSGGGPIKRPVSIGGTLHSSLASALAITNIDVRMHIQEGLPLIMADEAQLRQVFDELISNAQEAMRGGGKLTVTAQATWVGAGGSPQLKVGNYVKILFEDTGAGIPKDQISRIFEPYFTTKPMGKEKGSGLGLAICWSIIGKHGGAILAASEQGAGTSMTIHLPVAAPAHIM